MISIYAWVWKVLLQCASLSLILNAFLIWVHFFFFEMVKAVLELVPSLFFFPRSPFRWLNRLFLFPIFFLFTVSIYSVDRFIFFFCVLKKRVRERALSEIRKNVHVHTGWYTTSGEKTVGKTSFGALKKKKRQNPRLFFSLSLSSILSKTRFSFLGVFVFSWSKCTLMYLFPFRFFFFH